MKSGVILAVRSGAEGEIAAAVDAHRGLTVARRCADLAEAVAAAQAGIGQVALIGDQPHLDRAVLRRFAKRAVAVVGVPRDREAHDALLALGVSAVVPHGASPAEIARAAAEAAEAAESSVEESVSADAVRDGDPVGGRSGSVVAVWGPTGAPGRTTIAVNLAAEFSALPGGAILVDADTYGGAAATAFGIADEAPGLVAACRNALRGELDAPTLLGHATLAGPGLSVLTGIPRPSRWGEVPSAALDGVWAAAREAASTVVADCGFCVESDGGGEERNAATLSALESADVLVIVGAADPLGIQRLVQALSDLTDLDSVRAPRFVVANRVRAGTAGPSAERAVADALSRYAGVAETWIIPDDPRACDGAALVGAPLRDVAPRSPAMRSIARLATGVRAALPSAVASG